VIPGVEISSTWNRRELHLLGYFIRADHVGLNRALERVRAGRRERFREIVCRLARQGAALPSDRVKLVLDSTPSLGRRHLARLLVQSGFAGSRREAFHRFLGPLARDLGPRVLLPAEEAIDLIESAGGVASLAHPPSELTAEDFRALAAVGLAALEAEYPWSRASRSAELREAAAGLGLALTGGSDCHGPDPAHRRIGSHGITRDELADLRGWRGKPVSSTCRS
jgi:predicted metal-dependent phosphoesterase TrpH